MIQNYLTYIFIVCHWGRFFLFFIFILREDAYGHILRPMEHLKTLKESNHKLWSKTKSDENDPVNTLYAAKRKIHIRKHYNFKNGRGWNQREGTASAKSKEAAQNQDKWKLHQRPTCRFLQLILLVLQILKCRRRNEQIYIQVWWNKNKGTKRKTIHFQSLFLFASKDVPSFRVSCASFSIPRLFKAAAWR